MQAFFLPAIKPCTLTNRWVRSPVNWMDPRLRGTRAYYPRALASYWAWQSQSFAWEPDEFIFGDSGGYSVLVGGVHIDPRRALRWQLEHCTVGVILDTPPRPPQRLPFSECLSRTVAAVKAALPLYLAALDAGTSFRWWGAAHGSTSDELERWWSGVSRVYPFTAEGEGWAFKPLPMNSAEAVARVLDFARERTIGRAHLFACSSDLVIETVFALGAGAGLEFATFDSTSPITQGNYRALVVPTPYGAGWIKERYRDTGGRDTRARDYMTNVCRCASCDLLRHDLATDADLIDGEYWRARMVFHNVLMQLQRVSRLQEAANPNQPEPPPNRFTTPARTYSCGEVTA